MCGSSVNKLLDPAGLFTSEKTPDVQTTDPQAEADAAADAAAKAANADASARRKRKQASVLETGAGDSSVLSSGGKTQLGA